MTDRNVEKGPPGGETNVLSSEANELLTRWQKFIKMGLDDLTKIEAEIRRGDSLYKKKDLIKNVIESGEQRIVTNPPNHLKRRIKTNVDQIYSRNPKIVAKAKVPVFITIPDPLTGQVKQKDVSEERAIIIEEVMNHEMKESDLKSEAKACIRDAHIRPEAWMQLGYQYDEDNQTDAIYFRRRSLKDIGIDPCAQTYEGIVRRCRFMFLRWLLTAEEAKTMKLDIAVLESCGAKDQGDTETPKYEVFHMWDKERDLQGFCCKDGQAFPANPAPWPWKIDGFPFEPLRFDEMPDCRWGTAPIIEAEGIQQEMDDMRETMNRHIVNARPVNLYDSSIPQTTIETAAGRGKGGWIPIKGLSERPNPLITRHNDDQLDAQFFNHYDRNDSELTNILGSAPNDQLQVTNATATEAQQTARASANQTGSKIDVTEDWLKRCIRKTKQIIEQTYTTQRMTEITGRDGQEYWVKWTGNVLQDIDVDLEIGSTEKEDSVQRLQVALNMLGTMSKIQGIDGMKLAMDVLRRADYRNPEQYQLQQQQVQPPPAQPGGGGNSAGNPNPQPGGVNQQTNPMV